MNRENLRILADYLDALPNAEHFDMRDYVRSRTDAYTYPSELPLVYHECGTVACAAGHGPMAGIPALQNESWSDYQRRVFELSPDAYDWCFAGAWQRTDNTPKGAAARIRWLLVKGVPDDSSDQGYGSAPLCYTVSA